MHYTILHHIEVDGQLGIFLMDLFFPRLIYVVSQLPHQFLVYRLAPVHAKKGKTEKEVDHSRLVHQNIISKETYL